MKSIVISVLMLSMTFIFVNCENESQLTQNASDVETQILNKKPGGQGGHDGDSITFKENNNLIPSRGDLEGDETVMGCCPNAGPSPVYTMTLTETFPFEALRGGPYTGKIFMNGTGSQSPGAYIVQFWWSENASDDTTFIEIRGGVASKDKRTKVLTVDFEEAQCEIFINRESIDTVWVTFTLRRDPLRFNH
jgi:hypothetical protein